MTDPHLNAEQLFGFRLRRTCVCECVRGSFFFLMGREEWQLSAGGSCHWKNSLLLSFLPWTERSGTHDFGRRLWEEKSSDAAKRYSAPGRTSNYNAALFFFKQLIELCWRQDGAVEVEGRRLKLFLSVCFFLFFFFLFWVQSLSFITACLLAPR